GLADATVASAPALDEEANVVDLVAADSLDGAGERLGPEVAGADRERAEIPKVVDGTGGLGRGVERGGLVGDRDDFTPEVHPGFGRIVIGVEPERGDRG